MSQPLAAAALDQLFAGAHSATRFADTRVDTATIHALYEQLKWGPTSMNTQPARYVFLRTPGAREKLLPALIASNVDKTRTAPLTVIVAADTQFFDHLPTQFTAYDARPIFAGNAPLAEATALRNSSLQGAYLILAARALGLACGPMSGFDPAAVNATFFPDGRYRANFIVNLGYPVDGGHHRRGPRLAFDEVATVL